MNNSTISGDAASKTISSDAASHVATKTDAIAGVSHQVHWGSARLKILLLLCAFCLAPLTARADTAAQLAAQINAWRGGGSGLLYAVSSGNQVAVTGALTGVTQSLKLNLNADVVISWQGSITGTTTISTDPLVFVNGGAFVVGSSGKIVQTGTTSALRCDNATTSISGGTVSAISANAIALNFGGVLAVNSGTVSATSGNAIAFQTAVTVIISGGTVSATTGYALQTYGSATITGTGVVTGNIITYGNSVINFSPASSFTYSGIISGSGSVVKAGTGYLYLTGNNTYTGTTTINGGALFIGNNTTSGSIESNSIINNGSLYFYRSDNYFYYGVISGSGSVYQYSYYGTLTLQGVNTYTGYTYIDAPLNVGLYGSIASSAGISFRNYDAATFSISAGNKSIKSVSQSYGNSKITLVGSSTLTIGTSGQNDGGGTFAGVISGTGNVIKQGTGTLVFSGNNTYTGTTTVSGGTLQIGNGSLSSETGSVAGNIINNATLVFNRTYDYTYEGIISGSGNVTKLQNNFLFLTGNNTCTGTTTISAGSLYVGNSTTTGAIAGNIVNQGTLCFYRSNDYTYDGVISGSGDVYQFSVTGTLTFTKAHTYTGVTYIDAPLVLGANGSIASSSNVTFRYYNAAKLDISAGNKTIKALSGGNLNHQIHLGSRTLTIGTSTTSADGGGYFDGFFTGTGSIVKQGTVTLTLTNANNTASGTFNHNSGTVNYSGKWAGAYSKAAGTTLTVTGNMNVGGALTLRGGTINMNLSTNPASRIAVTGAVSRSGTNTINVTGIGSANSYTLITAGSGLGTANFSMSGNIGGLVLSSTATQLTLAAPQPAIAVSSSGLNNLKVGVSVNGTVTYTLSNGTYANSITASNFALQNPTRLPAGLSAGTAQRASNGTAVTIAITGTPTTANSSTATLNTASSIPANQIQGATSAVSPTGSAQVSAVAVGDGAAVSGAPTVNGAPTQTRITLNAVSITGSNHGGQVVEYALSTSTGTSAPSSGWQESVTFNSQQAATNYYAFARSKANSNCNAGTAQRNATAIRTADAHAIAVSSTGLSNLKVGQEVSASIVFTLSNGTYADPITASAFNAISNLPPGLNVGTTTRTSNTVVTVTITGSPTTYNTSTRSVTLPTTIPANQVQNATAAITRTGTVTASAVARGDGATVSVVPTVNGTPTQTSIAVNAAVLSPNPGSQTVQYAINQSASTAPSSSEWGTGMTFNGLIAGTTYYVWARAASNTNYNAGTARASEGITTALIKTVSVGAQNDVLTAGTAGAVSYTVNTANIAPNTAIMLNNMEYVDDITLLTATTTGNNTEVSIGISTDTPAGSHPLTLTIDGVTSATFYLTIGTPSSIAVSAIVVDGAYDLTAITVNNGSLQMYTEVFPANATNQTVAWSVENETGSAEISADGLLTAIDNGTVTVRATATDGSNVYGELQITISGQFIPEAPTIDGPAEMTLTEGYEATATEAYAIAGTDPVAVTIASGDDHFAWNDATMTLDIAAGLAAGEYAVVLTAANGIEPNATFTFTLTVEEEPIIPDPPTIDGPTEMTLTEGYGAISTVAYTVTGTAPVTVTISGSEAAITWNDETMKIYIAAGLAAGEYVVVLTAANGVEPNATLTFTLTVEEEPIIPDPPTIDGPTEMTLTEGYGAVSTVAYTITGTAPVTVTISTSSEAAITWNNETKKLDIAAGLTAGEYMVILTASNGAEPDATLTFTLIVQQEPTNPEPPAIDGPAEMTLQEGYEAISTIAYTITGTAPVTVTITTSEAAITWNNETKKLDIAAGLTAGEYMVILTASNGAEPDAKLTFTLIVQTEPTNPEPPAIDGPAEMTLQEGYEAVSTVAYTVTGTSPVTVTITASNAAITWNNATKKLDIAAGLTAGEYMVILTASNGIEPDATLTFTLIVENEPTNPEPPAIDGPAEMTLQEGYEAISTIAYTITGTAPVTVTINTSEAAITWNNETQKLDIATGLTAGEYVVALTAANGIEPDATLTFTLTVIELIETRIAPNITGPYTMSLQVGYEATSTDEYIITGTAPVTVTITISNAAISWNDATKKLDIATGLTAGEYIVVLTASNGIEPDATLTFTLTVTDIPKAPVITTESLPKGTLGEEYNQVLTATGDIPISWSLGSGILPTGLTLYDRGAISGTPITTGTFTFTVKATNSVGFDEKELTMVVEEPPKDPEPPTITTTTLPGGTVGEAYNETLAADGDTPITWGLESGTLPAGITIYTNGVISGTPTTEGTFDFTVRATNSVESVTKALSIVIAAAKSITGSSELSSVEPLKAWARNGLLHITGLVVGETLSIYTATGVLVYQNIATSDEADIPLHAQGMHLVWQGERTIKVVFQR